MVSGPHITGGGGAKAGRFKPQGGPTRLRGPGLFGEITLSLWPPSLLVGAQKTTFGEAQFSPFRGHKRKPGLRDPGVIQRASGERKKKPVRAL